MLEKEDMHILQRIHDFAVRITRIAPAAKQLVLMVERAVRNASAIAWRSMTDALAACIAIGSAR